MKADHCDDSPRHHGVKVLSADEVEQQLRIAMYKAEHARKHRRWLLRIWLRWILLSWWLPLGTWCLAFFAWLGGEDDVCKPTRAWLKEYFHL
jgi:hypothetical protein